MWLLFCVWRVPPASFDLVTSRCGVMFFADPSAAFGNLLAALKPGGRLCLAVWARMAENTHWKISVENGNRRFCRGDAATGSPCVRTFAATRRYI